MSTALDDFVAMRDETTYGTAVTPDRAYPFLDGTEGEWIPQWRQGAGVLGGAGRTTFRGSRAFLASGRGVVKLKAELESRGGGVLARAAFGVGSVAAITGGSVQQFHTQVVDLVLPSSTIQIRKILNSGAARVETFRGCTAMKTTLEQPFNGIPTIEVEFDALGFSTSTAAIVPTYSTTSNLYDAMFASIGYGGTLTAPTATTLASGLNVVTNWRSWELEIDQAAGNDDGWVLAGGVRSQPKVGMPTIKLKGEVEFNDTVIPDAYVAGTRLPWSCTWTLGEVVGAGNAQAQLVLPQIALTKGVPQVKPGEAPRTYPVEADVKNDGSNRDVILLYRTADTAL